MTCKFPSQNKRGTVGNHEFPGVSLAALRIAGSGELRNHTTRIYIAHKKVSTDRKMEKQYAFARIGNL